MTRTLSIAALLLAAFACDIENPCDRYADYICTCHSDDDDFDCEAVSQLAESPSSAVQDQCAVDLASQRAEDEAAGLDCRV